MSVAIFFKRWGSCWEWGGTHTHTPSQCPSVLLGASVMVNNKTVLGTVTLKAWETNFLGQLIKRQTFSENIHSFPFGEESKLISG